MKITLYRRLVGADIPGFKPIISISNLPLTEAQVEAGTYLLDSFEVEIPDMPDADAIKAAIDRGNEQAREIKRAKLMKELDGLEDKA